MPLVTVVMPVYNSMPHLKDAVHSILTQTFRDLELICVNDASTDGSLAYLKTIKDRRLRIVSHTKNKGEYAARNTGIAKAKGEYIAMMDADDVNTPNRLERQLSYLIEHTEVDAVGCSLRRFGRLHNYMRVPCAPMVIRALSGFGYGIILNATLMVRRQALLEEKLTYTDFPRRTDVKFAMQLVLRRRVANIREAMYLYRNHAASVTYLPQFFREDKEPFFKDLLTEKFGFTPSDKELHVHETFLHSSGLRLLINIPAVSLFLLHIVLKAKMPWYEKVVLSSYVLARSTLKPISDFLRALRKHHEEFKRRVP